MVLWHDSQPDSNKIYDAISHHYQWVIEVSHHTFYSTRDGNPSVETVFTDRNVYDDISENYPDYRL